MKIAVACFVATALLSEAIHAYRLDITFQDGVTAKARYIYRELKAYILNLIIVATYRVHVKTSHLVLTAGLLHRWSLILGFTPMNFGFGPRRIVADSSF